MNMKIISTIEATDRREKENQEIPTVLCGAAVRVVSEPSGAGLRGEHRSSVGFPRRSWSDSRFVNIQEEMVIIDT
jgi:hypothetical protein